MWRTILGASVLCCLLAAGCKDDDDPEDDARTATGSDGGDPASATSDGGPVDGFPGTVDSVVDGSSVSCRCDNGTCQVTFRGKNIQGRGKIMLNDVVVANEGRCIKAP